MGNRRTIKISTDNRVTPVAIDFDDFCSIQKALGGYFETVHTGLMRDYFGQSVIMLVDEEGLLKGLPANRFGCIFYGTAVHGHPITGDVILAVRKWEDIVEVPEPEKLMDRLLEDFNFLQRAADVESEVY